MNFYIFMSWSILLHSSHVCFVIRIHFKTGKAQKLVYQKRKNGNPVVIPKRANFLCAKKHISPMCPVKRLVRLQLVLLNYTISQWMMSKQTIRSYHFKTVETYYDQGQQSWALATTVATIWHCFKGQHNVTQLQFYSSCETTVFSVVILIMHM